MQYCGSGRSLGFPIWTRNHVTPLARQCAILSRVQSRSERADARDDAAGRLHDRVERDDPDSTAAARIAARAVMLLPHAVPVLVRPIRERSRTDESVRADVTDLVVAHPEEDVTIAPESLHSRVVDVPGQRQRPYLFVPMSRQGRRRLARHNPDPSGPRPDHPGEARRRHRS